MIESSRRGFITGLIAFAATAPAIVKASSLMKIKPVGADWRYIIRAAYIDVSYLEGMSQSEVQTIFYGNCDVAPVAFVGFHHNVPIFQHESDLS